MADLIAVALVVEVALTSSTRFEGWNDRYIGSAFGSSPGAPLPPRREIRQALQVVRPPTSKEQYLISEGEP